MNRERDPDPQKSTSVEEPDGAPPDDGLAYDPEMTDSDEANIPSGSESDPQAEPDS
jgi:hypothetical protein